MTHSLFETFAERLAQRLVERHQRLVEIRSDHIRREVCQVAAEVAGGERVYFPEVSVTERQAQRQRIKAALAAGMTPAQIASREGISVRWVRRLRGSVAGGTRQP